MDNNSAFLRNLVGKRVRSVAASGSGAAENDPQAGLRGACAYPNLTGPGAQTAAS
jgi:hypothetical protein